MNIAEDIETTRPQDPVYLLKNASQIRDPDKKTIGRAYQIKAGLVQRLKIGRIGLNEGNGQIQLIRTA